MAFIFRTLCVLICAAFLFAVANLFVSGVPNTEGTVVEFAAVTAADTPAPSRDIITDAATQTAPDAPGFGEAMMQVFWAAIGQAVTEPTLPGTASPGAASPGIATPLTIAPGTPLGATPNDTLRPATPIAEAPLFATRNGLKIEPDPVPADFNTLAEGWRGWMTANGIEAGALAVILPDGTEYGTGVGRVAEDLHPIMSLSKAITGICVDQLLLEANLDWDTTLGDIGLQMSQAGVTPRQWNEHITLASLVTHTSGLSPDLTQSNMASDTHGALGLHRRWATEALAETAIASAPGNYFYSNTNYAVLGVVVEALSGQSYAQACMDRVVTPAGITDAVIEGRYGSLSSYGGWEMSAIDHARLVRHWFNTEQPHMIGPRPDANGYRLGYFDDGEIVTHSGRFCRSSHPTGGVGSIFFTTRDGTTVSANWDACVDPGVRDALAQMIREQL